MIVREVTEESKYGVAYETYLNNELIFADTELQVGILDLIKKAYTAGQKDEGLWLHIENQIKKISKSERIM